MKLAGGGDWVQQQQQIRQEAVNNAYRIQKVERMPEKTFTKKEVIEEIQVKPDLFDQVYVGLRTVVPSWLLVCFIAVGALTMGIIMFKKQIGKLLSFYGNILKGESNE